MRAFRGMAQASRRALLGMTALALLATAPGALLADDAEGVEPESAGIAVFAGRTSQYGSELWSTQRTPRTTFLVADIRPGPQGSEPGPFWSLGTVEALFMADDGSNGRELWITDGTSARMVADLTPGAAGTSIGPSQLKVLEAGLAVFGKCHSYCDSADVWTFRGGAKPLMDERGEQVVFTDLFARTVEQRVAPLGFHSFVMAAEAPGYRDQLWVLINDGTSTSIARPLLDREGDPIQGPRQFTPIGDGKVLFFAFQWKSGPALWITDGTPRGTRILRKDFPGVSSQLDLRSLTSPRPGFALFQTGTFDGDDWAIWATDGTREGTRRARIVPGSSKGMSGFTVLDDTWLLFQHSNGQLWFTDGQRPNTRIAFRPDRQLILKPIGSSTVLFQYPHPRRVPDGPQHGFEPWVVTNYGTGNPVVSLLRNIDRRVDGDGKHLGSLDNISFEVTVVGPGAAVFPAKDGPGGRDVWFTSLGTTQKALELSDVTGAELIEGSYGPIGGGRAAFTMWTYNGVTWNYPQIWMTDGTRRGTRALCKGVNGSGFTPLGAFVATSEMPAPAALAPAAEPLQACDS